MNNLRCIICDKVNNKEIETNLGDFIGGYAGDSGKWFFPDPKNEKDFICIECKEEIDDTMYEFYLYDLAKQEKELNELIDQAIEESQRNEKLGF